MAIIEQTLCEALVGKKAETGLPQEVHAGWLTEKQKQKNNKHGDVYCEARYELAAKEVWRKKFFIWLGQSGKASQRKNSLVLGCAGWKEIGQEEKAG